MRFDWGFSLWVLGVGASVSIVLCAVALSTGRGILLQAMGVVLGISAVLVALERFVVTDAEAALGTLEDAVAAIETNRIDEVLVFFDPSDSESAIKARQDITWALEYGTVESLSILRSRVEIDSDRLPVRANARLLLLIQGEDRMKTALYRGMPLKLNVSLDERNGRWLISGYSLEE